MPKSSWTGVFRGDDGRSSSEDSVGSIFSETPNPPTRVSVLIPRYPLSFIIPLYPLYPLISETGVTGGVMIGGIGSIFPAAVAGTAMDCSVDFDSVKSGVLIGDMGAGGFKSSA